MMNKNKIQNFFFKEGKSMIYKGLNKDISVQGYYYPV